MTKLIYTWKQFDDDVKDIIQTIKKKKWKVEAVYGIPKGGLPLAVCLCNALNIPLTKEIGPNTLVVDDISDSGKTFREVDCKYITKTVSLFIRDTTRFIPNYFCRKAEGIKWITFPWEPKDKEAKRDGHKTYY